MFDSKKRTVVVVGAQWGDEGKGKLVDVLAEGADWVVRYQGGANAGHTVQIGEKSFILRQIPSGILQPRVKCAIGNGVVLDPETLFAEAAALARDGIHTEGRLVVSDRAHLVLPYHKLLDGQSASSKAIGTTGRGIGPAYEDKAARRGVRVLDLRNAARLRELVERGVAHANSQLGAFGSSERASVDDTLRTLDSFGPRLLDVAADVGLLIYKAIKSGEAVLLEGAQATLLDVDHGTYPFVTSSSPTSGGACAGSGVGPTRITRVIGILKAYTTRVGAGPFPTELTDARGEWLRKTGGEYGVTTGRPRRTGWFDAVIARYATRVNGITDYFVTKLDVLSGLEKVPVCVAYDVAGTRHAEMPMTQTEFHHATPVYEHLDGWWEDISGAKTLEDLPRNARAYLMALQDMIGAPVSAVGVGPRRDQTLQLRPLA